MKILIEDYIESLLNPNPYKTTYAFVPVRDENEKIIFKADEFIVNFKMYDYNNEEEVNIKCFLDITDEKIENLKKLYGLAVSLNHPFLKVGIFLDNELYITRLSKNLSIIIEDKEETMSLVNHLDLIVGKNDFASLFKLAFAFDQMVNWIVQLEKIEIIVNLNNIRVCNKGTPYIGNLDFIVYENDNEDSFNTIVQAPINIKNRKYYDILLISIGLHTIATNPSLWETLFYFNKTEKEKFHFFSLDKFFEIIAVNRSSNRFLNLKIELLNSILFNDIEGIEHLHRLFTPSPAIISFYTENLKVLIQNIRLDSYFDGYQYGFADNNKNIVIACTYDDTRNFSEGYAPVCKNGRWGFISRDQKEHIECDYDDVGYFSNGMCAVKKANKWGFINKLGIRVVHPKYHEVFPFECNVSIVYLNGKYGIIDSNGNELTPTKFDSIDPMKEGMFLFQKNKRYGYIDVEGCCFINQTFDKALNFQEGVAVVMNNKKWGFIKNNGCYITKFEFDDAQQFSENFAAICIRNKYGFINRRGKIVIPLKFDYVEPFSENISLVRINDQFGFIDVDGSLIVSLKYSEATSFYNNKAYVKYGGDWFSIDKISNFSEQYIEPGSDELDFLDIPR